MSDKPQENNQGDNKPAIDFARLLQESRSNDFDSRRIQVQRPFTRNCIQGCHGRQQEDYNFKLDLTPLNYGSFTGREFQPETKEQREAREVEQFEKASDFEKVVRVWKRLPDGEIDLGKKSIKLETNFKKAFEAIPGIKPDDRASEVLSKVKSVSLDNDKFTLDLKEKVELGIGIDAPIVGKLEKLEIGGDNKQVSLKIDLDKRGKLSLTDIKGVNVITGDGKKIGIKNLIVDGSKDEPQLRMTIDNPIENPGLPKWPDEITVPMLLKAVAPEIGGSFIRATLEKAEELKDLVQDRDFSRYLESIPDAGIRGKVAKMLKNLKSIDKNGDRIDIKLSGSDTDHDFGGATLTVKPDVSFRLTGTNNGPSLSSLDGIKITVPTPKEYKLGDYKTDIRGIGLDEPNRSGERTLTVDADNLIKRVEVDLDKSMAPVTNRKGNWKLYVTADNPFTENRHDRFRFPVKLDRQGNLDMKASELVDIVSDAAGDGVSFSFEGAANLGTSIVTGAAAGVMDWFGY